MAKRKKKSIPKADRLTFQKEIKQNSLKEEETEGFDFGGFPKDVSFKRNIGCGG